MKRFICFVLSCIMITSSLCIFPFAQGNDSADEVKTEASFELAYGGVNGIFSMTFDDGDIATTNWLNEVFERYNLYGSTMNIPYKNFATEELEETWREILAKGRLEAENHSMTHKPLPAQWWSNYSKYEANNTEANYQYEIVDAYNRILEVTGRAPLAFAPSNNTLYDDAVKVVQQYHYVMRQGLRWNISSGKWQSLDPIVNATYNSHEANSSSAGAGGWYNPYMMSFASNPIIEGLDVAANEGAWLITMCHDIGPEGDVDFDVALSFFEHAAKLQNEGKLWVTTFGNATKYIRERQNSTVNAVIRGENVYITVTMAEMTEDNLPLPTDVFNHPLTVKVAVPACDAVTYTVNSTRKYAKTFLENDKTYALVDVVPNSGECCVSPIDLTNNSTTPAMMGTIHPDGTFSTEGITVSGNATVADIQSYNKVYAKLDLSTFKEYNSASVSLQISDKDAKGKIHVYGLLDKADINGWSATNINGYNAPANNRFGAGVKLDEVYGSAPIATLTVNGAGNLAVDITSYVLDLLDLGSTAGTLIFTLDETSESDHISFAFSTNSLYTCTINFDDKTELVFPASTSVAAYAAADIYRTGNLTNDSFSLVSDGTQTNALKVQTTASKWNLFKILNLFPETLTTEDIGRKFTITFKMKETDNAKGTVSGIRMGMVGTHTGGVNCGNVGGGTAPNIGTQYNSVIIKNTALNTWETFTYEFEVTADVFAGTRPAQELGFYGNVSVIRTMWFDDIKIEECEVENSDNDDTTSLYSHTQDFESLTTGAYPSGFTKLGFGTFVISEEANATPADDAKKSIKYESIGASWERIFYLGASPYGTTDSSKQYTTEDIGRTFRVSFKIKTPYATKLTVGMVNYQQIHGGTATYYNKSSYTIDENQTNSWVKLTYTYTVTEALMAEGAHATELIIKMDSCKGASETNKANIYLDDFKCIELPENSETTMFTPTQTATIGNAEGLTVSCPQDASAPLQTYGYISFPEGNYDAVTDGLLSLALTGDVGQNIRILALREDLLQEMTLEDRFELLSKAKIDPNYIWLGMDLDELVANGEKAKINILNYLRAMKGCGASFLFVQSDILDTVYYQYGNGIMLTEEDYTTDGTISMENGTIQVNGTTLALHNILDNNENNIAKANTTYFARITASAGVKVSLLGKEAIVGENGTLTLFVTTVEEVKNPTLVFESETPFTITAIRVDNGKASTEVGNISMRTESAYNAGFVNNILQNISLDTSINVNFYFPKDNAPLSVQDREGNELLNTENIVNINGAEYYVACVKVAPKDAYRSGMIEATLANGYVQTLDASVLHYANHLFSLEDSSEYIKDAKALVRYILNYICEAALAYGGATESELYAFITDIVIDKTLNETIYEIDDAMGIEAFCLDLQSVVGMVFKVEKDFSGSITVTMNGKSDTYIYDAATPVGEEEYIVIENIPAYALRSDITVSVTNANGECATYLFNLATYTNKIGTDVLYAVYAYAHEASVFHAKYPTASTVK